MAFKRSAVRSRLSPPKENERQKPLVFFFNGDWCGRTSPFERTGFSSAEQSLFRQEKSSKTRAAWRRSRYIPLISTNFLRQKHLVSASYFAYLVILLCSVLSCQNAGKAETPHKSPACYHACSRVCLTPRGGGRAGTPDRRPPGTPAPATAPHPARRCRGRGRPPRARSARWRRSRRQRSR